MADIKAIILSNLAKLPPELRLRIFEFVFLGFEYGLSDIILPGHIPAGYALDTLRELESNKDYETMSIEAWKVLNRNSSYLLHGHNEWRVYDNETWDRRIVLAGIEKLQIEMAEWYRPPSCLVCFPAVAK